MGNKVDLVFEINNIEEDTARGFEKICRSEGLEPDKKVEDFIRNTVMYDFLLTVGQFYNMVAFNEVKEIMLKSEETDSNIKTVSSYKEIQEFEHTMIKKFATDWERKRYICWI